jgi:hypothetical protein
MTKYLWPGSSATTGSSNGIGETGRRRDNRHRSIDKSEDKAIDRKSSSLNENLVRHCSLTINFP